MTMFTEMTIIARLLMIMIIVVMMTMTISMMMMMVVNKDDDERNGDGRDDAKKEGWGRFLSQCVASESIVMCFIVFFVFYNWHSLRFHKPSELCKTVMNLC